MANINDFSSTVLVSNRCKELAGKAPFSQLILMITLFISLSTATGAVKVLSVPYKEDSNVVTDGLIGPDEYGGLYNDTSTHVVVYWEHNGTHINVGLVSYGTGWVSIGFGSKNVGMDGANIVIGYIDEEGELVLTDEVGVGRNHFPDVEKGGRDDISAKAGSEEEGQTIIEFVFPLVSGDGLDHNFVVNRTYGFFLGYHESAKDLSTYHSARSDSLGLFIEPVPGEPTKPLTGNFKVYYYTIAFFSFVIVVGFMVRYFRRPKVIRFRKPDHWP